MHIDVLARLPGPPDYSLHVPPPTSSLILRRSHLLLCSLCTVHSGSDREALGMPDHAGTCPACAPVTDAEVDS